MRSRRGFTLMEVAVAAVIIAMLAAVSAPSLIYFLDKQRAKTTGDLLASVGAGIAAFGNGVKTAAGATNTTYPGFISELSTQIVLGSAIFHNSCGVAGTFNANAVSTWATNGPFVTFFIPAGGLQSPLGLLQDSLVRNPASATAGTLGIRLSAIDTADATLLDQVVDGGDGGASGVLRIGNVSAGHADITYLVPVGAHC